MNAALSLWVISDGRRGIENQALGLAEAIARLRDAVIHRHLIESQGLFKKASAGMQFTLKSKPSDYGLGAPYPSLAIGCGRQAIAPLRALKRARGNSVFTIYVQDPKTDTAHFDLVIAPEHDGLTGANVETMIGSPNRVTGEVLSAAKTQFASQLSNLPTQKAAMLIGGPSKARELSKALHVKHLETAQALLAQGYGLMISPSRRTPDWAIEAYRDLAKGRPDIWLYDGEGDNPYFAFLAAADKILVTEESTNMLTEACATGAPVFRLQMKGSPGKFASLYKALEARCGVTAFGLGESESYAPLNETERLAESALARFNARSAVIN